MAIGGAEDKVREKIVLRRFVAEAGGPDASIVVLATASELPETGERYSDLFYGLDAGRVEVLRIRTREDALDAGPDALDVLEDASGFFMTGGSQLRISSALGGTPVSALLRRRHAEGMVVAGTSAGAAVLSQHMISMGESGGTPRRRPRPDGPGPRLRARSPRRSALPPPRPHGAGWSPPSPTTLSRWAWASTRTRAAMVGADGVLTVLGAGGVTVVDASGLRFTDSHAVHRGQPVAMLGLKVDFLTTGCRYDTHRRVALAPDAAPAPRVETDAFATSNR